MSPQTYRGVVLSERSESKDDGSGAPGLPGGLHATFGPASGKPARRVRMNAPTTVLRRSCARAFLVATSLILSLGAVEVGMRLCHFGRLTIPAGIEHPQFHHRLKPSTTYHFSSDEFAVDVRTNRYSLRGPDPVLPKPPGVIRILMLGDSFIFGFPVRDEETSCWLVEHRLRAEGYPVEVINGGVSGYSPTLEYLSLRDEFLSFEPDLVVLWVDLGDVQEDHWFQKNLLYDADGRIVRCDPRYIHGRFDRWEWLKNHSLLANYLDRKVVRTLTYIRTLGLAGYVRIVLRRERAKAAVAKLKSETQAADLADYDRFLLVRPSMTPERIKPYWDLTGRYLVMIRDVLAQRGIPLLVGVYPYGMVVGPNQWATGRVFWGFEPGKTYDAAPALALLTEFTRDQRVPFINTFDSFRAAGTTTKLFYDEDGHFTPAGQQVLAEHLLRDPVFRSSLSRRAAQLRRRE